MVFVSRIAYYWDRVYSYYCPFNDPGTAMLRISEHWFVAFMGYGVVVWLWLFFLGLFDGYGSISGEPSGLCWNFSLGYDTRIRSVLYCIGESYGKEIRYSFDWFTDSPITNLDDKIPTLLHFTIISLLSLAVGFSLSFAWTLRTTSELRTSKSLRIKQAHEYGSIISDYDNMIDSCTQIIDSGHLYINLLKDKIEAYERIIADLSKNLAEADIQTQHDIELERENDDLRHHLVMVEDFLRKHNKERDRFQHDCQLKIGSTNERLLEVERSLGLKIVEREADRACIHELDHRLQWTESQLACAQAQAESLKGSHARVEELEEKLENSKLEHDIDLARLTHCQEQNQSLENTVIPLVKEKEALQTQVAELKQHLKTANFKTAQLANLGILRQCVSKLESQLVSAQKERDAAKRCLKTLQNEGGLNKKEVREQAKTVKELESQLTVARKDEEAFQLEVAQLKNDIAAVTTKATARTAKPDHSLCTSIIDELEDQIDLMEAAAEMAQYSTHECCRNRIEELEDHLDIANRELKELRQFRDEVAAGTSFVLREIDLPELENFDLGTLPDCPQVASQ
jgi:chromosome segregation ATPase